MSRVAPVIGCLLASLLVAGCSSDYTAGASGFVSGDGAVRVIPVADREPPGELSGSTLSGRHLSLRDLAGQVVVVNVWGSWCAPCRAEADDLAQADRELAGERDPGVAFVGIDTRDYDKAAPRAFVRAHEIGYPSLYDPGGVTLLAFAGTLPPNTIPSTLVIDADGRVAASILGPLPSTQTLVDVVREVAGG